MYMYRLIHALTSFAIYLISDWFRTVMGIYITQKTMSVIIHPCPKLISSLLVNSSRVAAVQWTIPSMPVVIIKEYLKKHWTDHWIEIN